MVYSVQVSVQEAAQIGISLKENAVITSNTYNLKENFDRIKEIANKQWATERERCQLRRKNSNGWLCTVMEIKENSCFQKMDNKTLSNSILKD